MSRNGYHRRYGGREEKELSGKKIVELVAELEEKDARISELEAQLAAQSTDELSDKEIGALANKKGHRGMGVLGFIAGYRAALQGNKDEC